MRLLLVITLIFVSCSGGEGDSVSARNRSRSLATLDDFWNGRAQWVQTAAGMGSEFKMHFVSAVPGSSLFYYVKAPLFRESFVASSVALALTSDGVRFRDAGEVLPAGAKRLFSLSGTEDFRHQIGSYDASCNGWSVGKQSGELAYRQESLAPGSYTLGVELEIAIPSGPILLIEILEDGQLIASRSLSRENFQFEGVPTELELSFTTSGSPAFRLTALGGSNICFTQASVKPDLGPERDERLASFPSVWLDGSTYYMVYEGASGRELGIDGEIRLATSVDGRNWLKHPDPIFVPPAAWRSVNIGTPSLWKQDDTWYLFFHGFDGKRLEVGVLAGPDLLQLTVQNGGGPILTNGEGWDAGTVGKRSLIYEAPYFYMVYEGSTLPSSGRFEDASWASGLARSTDLIHWEKFPGNPIIGSSGRGFGFDGPEFYRDASGTLHIYFRNMQGSTDRVSLQ